MKYIIKESQYKELIERKKNQKIVETILSKIDRANKSLREGVLINEAVVDIITIYKKKGLINNYVKNELLKSGKIEESQIKRIKL